MEKPIAFEKVILWKLKEVSEIPVTLQHILTCKKQSSDRAWNMNVLEVCIKDINVPEMLFLQILSNERKQFLRYELNLLQRILDY